MEYKYTSTDKRQFCLHDCRATSVDLINNRLIFHFPNGIYYDDYSDDWPNTGKAEVEYRIDGVMFYLFVDKNACEIRERYSAEELAQKINTGAWELEFGYQYDGYQEVLHTGWIWQEQEPWMQECQMFIETSDDAIYRWDLPADDKE